MSDVKLSTYMDLMSALATVKTSATELTHETRTHAEEHFARLDAMRKGRENDGAINAGIERATSQV